MYPDNLILICQHCGTKNRLAKKRLSDNPLCGKCKLPLPAQAVFTEKGLGSKTDKYLNYRGMINTIKGRANELVFTTLHAEKKPTGVYRLNTDNHTLLYQTLYCGATALAVSDNLTYAAGTDGWIYNLSGIGNDPVALEHQFSTTVSALALLAEERLAVLTENTLAVLNGKDGGLEQTFALPENEQGSTLAVDETGRFIVAGTTKGTVMVFEAESKRSFQLSEAATLHAGKVTALLFEKDNARFLSAGSDNKLLLTHVRGALEPEDRGKKLLHTKPISALTYGRHRFYSASADKTIKAWPATKSPYTLREGVKNVLALTTVNTNARPHLAALFSDNTIGLFLLDDAGKPVSIKFRYHDAYAKAKYELKQKDPSLRQSVLETLLGYDDRPAIEIIARSVTEDTDPKLRLAAATMLADASHIDSVSFLEKYLSHTDQAVRLCAFKALVKKQRQTPLNPVDLALSSGISDVGLEAIGVLEKLAGSDDQAFDRLEGAINHRSYDVRKAALFALEKNCPSNSPKADLLGLGSKHWDLRHLALIRFYQRNILSEMTVQAALRNFMQDNQQQVRLTAFHLSLMAAPNLLKRLRVEDPELNRQIFEIETFGQSPKPEFLSPLPPKEALTPKDFAPLLKAMACRATDICLAGACAMSLFKDSRAFGVLMQLSRDKTAGVRSDVCRALAHLNDPRGIKRLRVLINDPAEDVRDAAFSALAQLYSDDPLLAVDAGLSAFFEEIRRRALDILMRAVSEESVRIIPLARQLLLKALNDDGQTVRNEAFKAILNLQIDGDQKETLSFLLNSIHVDIRRNVLLEVLAHAKKDWAKTLLTDFFNDPDQHLRMEAYEYAVHQKKRADMTVLEQGIKAKYADIRLKTVDELIRLFSESAQRLLIEALSDVKMGIRQKALGALLEKDVKEILSIAFDSTYPDIRLRSAEVAAGLGDDKALAPLLELLAEKEPDKEVEKTQWIANIKSALNGLEMLGDPAAGAAVEPFLDHKNSSIRGAAIKTLCSVCRPGADSALKRALKHTDNTVRLRGALGLCYLSDPIAERVLFSKEANKIISPEEQLTAAFILSNSDLNLENKTKQATRDGHFDRLLVFLDHNDLHIQKMAFLLLMFTDSISNESEPHRLIASLSALNPKIRLLAARALESAGKGFDDYLTKLINEKGDRTSWSVPVETVQQLRTFLFTAPLNVRVASIHLLFELKNLKEDAWLKAWRIHRQRYQNSVTELNLQPSFKMLSEDDRKDLVQLAFGVYVGLVRDQSGSLLKNIRLNQTALNHIFSLANRHEFLQPAVTPIFIQTLANPNREVRLAAFDYLKSLEMDSKELGAEALQAGYKDLGVMGLELLTSNESNDSGRALLESVMLLRKDGLELDAAKLLSEKIGRPRTSEKALESASDALRKMALKWLAADAKEDETVKAALRKATYSRFTAIRLKAALALAEMKDKEAYSRLSALFGMSIHHQDQPKIIAALEELKDNATPDLLLSYLEKEESQTPHSNLLIKSIGNFRQRESFDRLMPFFYQSAFKNSAFDALFAISGFDQKIEGHDMEALYKEGEGYEFFFYREVVNKVEDPDTQLSLHQGRMLDRGCAVGDSLGVKIEENSYIKIYKKARFESAHHPDLFIRLFDAVIEVDDHKFIRKLLPVSLSLEHSGIDAGLGLLTGHENTLVRHEALNAVGFRLRHHQRPRAPLLTALKHQDLLTSFTAAEILADCQQAEGLNVLLATVDLMDDFSIRRRAVKALGKLADENALLLLLKLAGEDQHALQGEALEAIGRMKHSAHADEIFRLLTRFADPDYGWCDAALMGLAHFDSLKGWQVIRKQAGQGRQKAIELLRLNNDPATIDTLLNLIQTDRRYWLDAYKSAQILLGPDSVEPDYALLQCHSYYAAQYNLTQKVCRKGDPKRIFAIWHNCQASVRQDLMTGLLRLKPLPLKEALEALESAFVSTVGAAAAIIGRAAELDKEALGKLATALDTWIKNWHAERLKAAENSQGNDELSNSLTPCLEKLIWAAGRHQTAKAILQETAGKGFADHNYFPLRKAAIEALENFPPDQTLAQALRQVVQKDQPELRVKAALILKNYDNAALYPMGEELILDPQSTAYLEAFLDPKSINSAMQSSHYQGVIIPLLIKNEDVASMRLIAMNRKLPETERLGAIEALAKTGNRKAEAILIAIGENANEDEELRKCAWRGLKRSKRARLKAEKR